MATRSRRSGVSGAPVFRCYKNNSIMRKAIDQDTLQALIETGATWLPVRSRREPVRIWASLTAVGRFASGIGIRELNVEL